jgi:hypothetical protein
VGGAITLAGWALGIQRWTDWRGDGISMFVNTAICVIAAAVALVLISWPGPSWRIIAGRSLAVFVSTIGGLTLLEHLFGINFGIDTMVLARDWGQHAAMAPMRMGPPASTSLTILGVALVLATMGDHAQRVASLLATLILLIASLSLTGYIYGADQLFGIARFTGIAWQTSTMLAALAIATTAAIPEHGLAAALRRDDAGGALVRRLIVPVVVIPFVLGWLNVEGQESHAYDAAFGTSLRTLTEIVMFFALLWWAASRLNLAGGSRRSSNRPTTR